MAPDPAAGASEPALPGGGSAGSRRGGEDGWVRGRVLQGGLIPRAIVGRAAVVAGDQPRAAPAVEVGVPGPGEVARALRVQPASQRSDVSGGAVVLTDLAGDDRDLGEHWGDLAGPARLGAAGVEVVGVPGCGQVVVGVSRFV